MPDALGYNLSWPGDGVMPFPILRRRATCGPARTVSVMVVLDTVT